jgi:hypothetical protein
MRIFISIKNDEDETFAFSYSKPWKKGNDNNKKKA